MIQYKYCDNEVTLTDDDRPERPALVLSLDLDEAVLQQLIIEYFNSQEN